MAESNPIRWFRELSMADLPLVGGKTASLGEMFQLLTPLGVRIPDGFAVTAPAYREALDRAEAWGELHRLLDGLDKRDVAALARAGARAREIVYAAPMPAAVERGIRAAWRQMQEQFGADLSVAVRSSATAEDLPTASFAGQHDTYLNIRGEQMLIDAVKRCQASLFTDRAISYRIDNGFDHFKVYLSVAVMQMVRSDLAASGVLFTIDTESGHPDVVFITGAWGLGENVVQGAVDPDEFYVHKPTFKQGHRCVLSKRLGRKQVRMVYAGGRTREPVINQPTPAADRARFCLSDADVLELADAAIKIEDHYSRLAGRWRPMDVEWAKDGPDGKLYIVQARPETSASQRVSTLIEEFVLEGTAPVRVQGRSVGERIASGAVRCITNAHHLGEFRPGEVLVADTTTPDWEPVMKTAAAIVTNRGGRTCHAAIVARELGIPAVVGAQGASEALRNGETVTVSCAEGDVGRVYEGAVPFRVDKSDLAGLKRPATEIMVNLGNPELAFKTSLLPCDGVGLARMEFIINEHIKVHPMAVLHPERIVDEAQRAKVAAQVAGFADGASYFIEKLAEGVGTIAAAFFPRPVIIRLSDFKSNEYAALLGGRDFEPHEENPMLGFRGAARYIHPAYEEGFALECAALKRVREQMGLINLKVMVPFCRRLDEARRVLDTMAKYGLKRGENGLQVYVMCEIPNNVLLIDEFAQLFDGFSIGSNDLTQLTLGVDRDSAIVAESFDERDPGMRKMFKMAVEGARRNCRHSGICGQAPSDHLDVAQYLVELGIDSISLTPDRVLRTMQAVQQIEQALGRPPRR
ncbi:phosphoenolpyruvate synthase [Piscinibacter sp.]|jgi:pyruvate,water dikinase|uniref:phosphoenolpyruvate synthase n=1 Tax=Piscinibacter sp. TaxID=1903157 RepID=UPI00355937A0